jgi:hypothetical protein
MDLVHVLHLDRCTSLSLKQTTKCAEEGAATHADAVRLACELQRRPGAQEKHSIQGRGKLDTI